MAQAQFQSNSSSTPSTVHVLADNATVASLISSITANCSSDLNTGSTSHTPIPYTGSNATAGSQPASAVQYYRASSVVLTLDGYNNTALFSSNSTAPTAPLPNNVDMKLLVCLNDTIGRGVPLVNAGVHWEPPYVGMLGLVWITYWLTSLVV